MNEDILQYIWKHQYFKTTKLKTTSGLEVQVLDAGFHNEDSGPDFSDASIQIGALEWHGNVEVHYKSSDWYRHKHDTDTSYDSTILHVVWSKDKEVYTTEGDLIPTLSIADYVDFEVLQKAELLLNQPQAIPCQSQIGSVPNITRLSMIERSGMQRIQVKAAAVIATLEATDGDWEEAAYRVFMRSMGFKTNNEPFAKLSELLPYKILCKHADQQLQIEALLFGQSGFLTQQGKDEYHDRLVKEYDFLSAKYGLSDRRMSPEEWKFFRTRPGNFPTIRIAQIAAFATRHINLFATLTQSSFDQVKASFQNIQPSDYWKRHNRFGEKSRTKPGRLGEKSIENLVINTSIPLLAAYSMYSKEQVYLDRALSILEAIPAESNSKVDAWKPLGFEIQSAFDSQALLMLTDGYCKPRKCLHCSIGTSLVRN